MLADGRRSAMMDERSRRDEPLFLDESPDTPHYSKPPCVSIDELFCDEAVLGGSCPRPSVDPRRRGLRVWLPAARSPRTASVFLILFLAATLIAFTAVNVWLR